MNNNKHVLPNEKDAEEARRAKNRYQRDWYAKHPGKSTEYSLNYWKRRVLKEAQEKEVTNNAG